MTMLLSQDWFTPSPAMWSELLHVVRSYGYAYGDSPDARFTETRRASLQATEPGTKTVVDIQVNPSNGGDVMRSAVLAPGSHGTRQTELPFVRNYTFSEGYEELHGRAAIGSIEIFITMDANTIKPEDFPLRMPLPKLPRAWVVERTDHIESLLRHAAAIFSQRDTTLGSFTVGGVSLPALVRGNDVYSRVDKMPGLTVERNADRFFHRFAKGDRELLVPIGSDQVRVDGEWRDVGRVVPMKDGSLYVPIGLARWIAGG